MRYVAHTDNDSEDQRCCGPVQVIPHIQSPKARVLGGGFYPEVSRLLEGVLHGHVIPVGGNSPVADG
jgi:hypothetical protein